MATHNGPESRLAQYLAKIAGEDVPTPKPSTEAEIYLNKIAQSGGGSGGGGVFVVNVTSENLADVSTYIFDKTFAEMKEAAVAGKTIIASFEHENSLVTYDPGGPDEEGEEFPEAIYMLVSQSSVKLPEINCLSVPLRSHCCQTKPTTISEP